MLSFSLIMLNTDLHNPRIEDKRRMTLAEFLNNNRDIDGGKPLPAEFMTALYNDLKANEIELRSESVGDEMAALDQGKLEWARLVAQRSGTIASASFTPRTVAFGGRQGGGYGRGVYPAGLHERDMFGSIADSALAALVGTVDATKDDFLLLKALQVGQHEARGVCAFLWC